MNFSNPGIFRLTFFALAAMLSASMVLTPTVRAETGSDDLTDLSLEDLMKVVVVSASKFAQTSTQAPSAVQVLTAEDIRLHGWRTLAEALGSLPGLYASNDRAFGFLGARGFMVPGDYNMRFLLLLDGQPLNDNLYGQANLGHEFRVDMSLIDRIEYVPGPGSSIYGSNAMFGVVNVMTRSAANLPRLSISTRLQGDGWREFDLKSAHRGEGNGPDLVFSLSRANKTGRDLYYPDAIGIATSDGSASRDGLAHGLDSMTVTRAFAGLKLDGFALSAWAAQRDVHPSSALFNGNFDDGRLHLIDSSYGVTSAYQRAIDDQLNLHVRLAYQKITYQGDTPYLDPTIGSYVNRDEAVGTWLSGEARLLYIGFQGHKLVTGIDFQSDLEALQKNADLNVAVNTPFSTDTKVRRYGVYFQDEWNFSPDWHLNAGLRSDSYSSGKSQISPRLGLIWNPSDRATLKLLAGQAYRSPNAYEANYARAPFYLASTGLQPETIRTLEAVAEYRLEAAQEIGASVFDYQLNHLIRQIDIGTGQLQYQNEPAVSVRGLEIFHRLRNKNGLNLMSSMAFNHSHDAAGRALSNSPRWVAKLRLRQPVWQDNLLAAVEMNALGPRTIAWRDSRSHLGVQSQVNLALTATRLRSGLELQLRLVNLFDTKIVYPASNETGVPTLPVDGRQWQLGLNYAF
ncbi:MAG: TonB-dependent receptor [Undibacterium sp.]|uniref:TonB-dependent receptor plug domain-containing protein n=1 Tax=Undibacterium sp. TaxID=1914977 RepID=UPI002722FDF4|nr:TonB-dependent receptor [Undibacterium sp.]MDO8650674.1 TonB-dependent receptor [Undibacterium sp.]